MSQATQFNASDASTATAQALANYGVNGSNRGNKSRIQSGTSFGGDSSDPTAWYVKEDIGGKSTARTLVPGKNPTIDVVKKYPWTLSNVSKNDQIPYIQLTEYKCNESSIKRQLSNFFQVVGDQFKSAGGANDAEGDNVLDAYQELYPKDEPTKFVYLLPYFNKIGFQLSTPNWNKLDSIGEAMASGAKGIAGLARTAGFGGVADTIETITEGAQTAGAVADVALNFQYPTVGVADRPRVFGGHGERSITVSFPLYNTLGDNDWKKNRDLIYLLMSQNLFNKRDTITGIPPVFYDVFVPGQYYSFASAMTDITVENLGNMRLLYDEFIIPDAYQITLTLSELTMPSKNQFEAVTTPGLISRVKVIKDTP